MAQFEGFVRDAKLLGGPSDLNEFKITQIYTKVLQAPEENHQMNVDEFCEALAAIAVYHMPDPYLPIKYKVESLLGKIHEIMKRKYRRLLSVQPLSLSDNSDHF